MLTVSDGFCACLVLQHSILKAKLSRANSASPPKGKKKKKKKIRAKLGLSCCEFPRYEKAPVGSCYGIAGVHALSAFVLGFYHD